IRIRAEISGEVGPTNELVSRIVNEAEYWDGRPAPIVCVLLNWNEVVAISRSVRFPGLDLKGGTKGRNHASLRNINVSVFSDIVLLRDFLKYTSVTLEECLNCVYTFP